VRADWIRACRMRTRTRPTNTSTSKTISTGSRRSQHFYADIATPLVSLQTKTRNSPLPCCELECISRLDLQIVVRRFFLLCDSDARTSASNFLSAPNASSVSNRRGRVSEFRGPRHNACMTQRECRQDLVRAAPSLRWGARKTHHREVRAGRLPCRHCLQLVRLNQED